MSYLTNEQELLVIIPKSNSQRIHASLVEYMGRNRFDLRMFYRGDDGEWMPSKRGVVIELDYVPVLIDVLQKLQAQLDEVTA
jgi:hypothetical protein